jgi:hypothetical protein
VIEDILKALSEERVESVSLEFGVAGRRWTLHGIEMSKHTKLPKNTYMNLAQWLEMRLDNWLGVPKVPRWGTLVVFPSTGKVELELHTPVTLATTTQYELVP